jgi:hypothetical protein
VGSKHHEATGFALRIEAEVGMTPTLHTILMALVVRFYLEGISDEEWNILQVHMNYCDRCKKSFERFQSVTLEQATVS